MVNGLVLKHEHRPCRSEEGHCPTLAVQQSSLTDGWHHSVKGHNVARGCYPQWEVGVTEVYKVGQTEYVLVRYLVWTPMATIVNYERACGLLLKYGVSHLRIGVARCRCLLLVGIPHHLLDQVARMCAAGLIGNRVDVPHMYVGITVIAQKHQSVLPASRIVVLHVVDGLVYYYLGLCVCRHGEPSHCHVWLVRREQASSLSVVKQAEIAIVNIACSLTERVLTLICQQVVVGRHRAAVGGEHAVVPHAVAKKQQEAWHVLVVHGTVVEHLQVAAVGIGIGSTTGEFVEQFVCGHHFHSQTIVTAMEIGKPVGLRPEFLRCRYYYHHVDCAVGMQVLIGYVIYIFRRRVSPAQLRCRLGLCPCHRHEVQVDRTSCYSGNFHSVLGMQPLYTI